MITPEFSLSALIGVGIPLFVVTMVSQNIPGIAVLRTAGYAAPISPIISWTGFTTLLIAPFGGFAINLAAITAAICTGREAHADADKRYIAGLSTGVCYLLLGVFSSLIASLFSAFPVNLYSHWQGSHCCRPSPIVSIPRCPMMRHAKPPSSLSWSPPRA